VHQYIIFVCKPQGQNSLKKDILRIEYESIGRIQNMAQWW
jgi:hypothetical protein